MTDAEKCQRCLSVLDKLHHEMGDCLTAASVSLARLKNVPGAEEVVESIDKALEIFRKCDSELHNIEKQVGFKHGNSG